MPTTEYTTAETTDHLIKPSLIGGERHTTEQTFISRSPATGDVRGWRANVRSHAHAWARKG